MSPARAFRGLLYESLEKRYVLSASFDADEPLSPANDPLFQQEFTTTEVVAAIRGEQPLARLAQALLDDTNRELANLIDLSATEELFALDDRAIVEVALAPGADPLEVVTLLEALEFADWSAPNYLYTVENGGDPREFTPNDPLYVSQYHHLLMQNDLAWDVTLGDPSIIVAVTDDGVDIDHVDLAPNIWVNADEIPGNGIDDDTNGFIDDVNGWDFRHNNNDPRPNSTADDHGTHVAGIVAARTNNAIGVAGTASGISLMPLQFYSSALGFTSTIIAAAYAYAADNGAKIVSTSYAIDGFVNDPTFLSGLNYLYGKGVLHLNSAGNNDELNPARQVFDQSLFVASTDSSDVRSGFSNYGFGIDIAAPGSSILSTVLSNAYGTKSGTSMATPNAAAAAALIWSAHPTWTREQVAAQLIGTADNIDAVNPAFVGLLGSGRVNSFRAVTETLSPPRIRATVGLPAEGASAPGVISTFGIDLANVLDPATVTISNFELRRDGPDQTFDTPDDVLLPLSFPAGFVPRIGTNRVTFNTSVMVPGNYRFRALAGGLKDPFGSPLDGNGDGIGGDFFQRTFSFTPLFWDPDGNPANNDLTTGAGLGGAGQWNTTGLTWFNGVTNVAWYNNRDDVAIFTGPAGVVSLGTAINARSLRFNTTGYSVQANTLAVSSGQIDAPTGVTATIQSQLSGSGGLTTIGNGTVVISNAANNYVGTTTINAGILRLGANNAIPATSPVALANVPGATLSLNNLSATIASLSGGGASGGNVTLGSGRLTLGGDNSSSLYSGSISGSGGITKNGTGELVLESSNPFTGQLFINAGTLSIASVASIGATSGVFLGSASPATLTYFGSGGTTGRLFTINGPGGGTIRLASSGVTWTLSNTINTNGNPLTFNVAASSSITTNSTISGSGNVTKIGTGTWTANGLSTYSGTTTWTAGAIAAGASSNGTPGTAGPLGVGTLIINSTGSLSAVGSARSIGNAVTIGNSFVAGGTLALTMTGAMTLTAARTVNVTNTAGVTFSGNLGGAFALTKAGAGALVLSGTNSYTNTTISGGVLRVGSAAAIPSLSAVALSNVAGVVFDLNNFDVTIGSLAGGGSAGGEVRLGSGTLTTGGLNTNTTFTGLITGTGGITKVGTGTQTLGTSVNTYSGATTVSAGTLQINTTGSISGSTSLILGSSSPAVLAYNNTGGGISKPITLNGPATIREALLNGTLSLSGPISTGGNPLTFDINGGSITATGVISGAGSLTKNNTGTLILTNSGNTYSGQTIVNAGTLQINFVGSIGGTSGVLLGSSSPAVLAYNNTGGSTTKPITLHGPATIREAQLNGTLTLSGPINTGGNPLTFDVNGGTITASGEISGAGNLIKVNSGTLHLTGNNSYNGLTEVNGGRILVSGSIVSATTVNSGGTLGGTGTVDGVLVQSGGTLAPGLSPGILNTGNVTLDGGAVYRVELNTREPGFGHDQGKATGAVNIDGATLELLGTFAVNPNLLEAFVIIDNDDSDPVGGTFAGLSEGAPIAFGGGTLYIAYTGGDGNDVVLTTNVAPTAVIGGPYAVEEEASIVLDASSSLDPNQPGATLIYEWDFDNDGEFDDAVGPAPAFRAAGVDGPALVPIAVRVTDNAGLFSTDSTLLVVHNANPTATPNGYSTAQAAAVAGNLLTDNTGSDADSDPAGPADPLTVLAVTAPSNGSLVWIANGSFVYQPNSSFAGTDQFTYTIGDDDGGTASATVTITVLAAPPGSILLIPDTLLPGPTFIPGEPIPPGAPTALLIVGTTESDKIVVHPGANRASLGVVFNDVAHAVAAPTGRIIVMAGGGNDNVQIAGAVANPVWAYAGEGDDRVFAGNGVSLVFGGPGKDQLLGGAARDILVGGADSDMEVGNAGDDILIGPGTTKDDLASPGHEKFWNEVLLEWNSSNAPAARMQNLTTGDGLNPHNNGSLLVPQVVADPATPSDKLNGSAGQNWLLTSAAAQGAEGESAAAGAYLLSFLAGDPLDVNRDGVVSPLDALLVINFLNLRPQGASLEAAKGFEASDVNLDGFVSALDALLVINQLNSAREPDNTEATAADAYFLAFGARAGDATLELLGWLSADADPRRLRRGA